MNKATILAVAMLIAASSVEAQTSEQNLKTWNFSRDSINWQKVDIPHDWAISGPFDKKWDLQYVAITQNGEKTATEKSGRSGSLPWIGQGWYTTTVNVKANDYRHAYLCFDGAMAEPVVYVNGKEAGRWAYGYNAFRVDATPFLHDGDNTITVSLKNVEESSRWYPGAGLYRPVKLVLTQEARIDPWKVFARTVKLQGKSAVIAVDAQVEGTDGKGSLTYSLKGGNNIIKGNAKLEKDGRTAFEIKVPNARLWTPETPNLYTVTLSYSGKNNGSASYSFKTGIRTVRVSKEGGFQLNGRSRKIQGVCLHHDLGPLGAAVNKAALIRQIKLMKDMGADAIRTSHNMPSEMQMQICDSLGMMVMAESFDMWEYPKCKNGYARFFDEWSDKDIENLVRHHRNHPSIVMWSIGNEIPEQGSEKGKTITARLQGICHRLDPTRPVTQGFDRAEQALKCGMAQEMDVPGFNYRVFKYGRNIKQLPQGFLLGSETASTVSSRGVYKLPVKWGYYNSGGASSLDGSADGQVSSYDNGSCSWSNLPEEDFIAMEDAPYTIGQFIWTGIDYLGEPTPYDEFWPSRSSYFGACDLAGIPKDRYYLYRSVWNKKSHTLHLLPHWTWPGHEGETIPVFCYTDYPEAELYVNGKSQGRIKKNRNVEGEWATGHKATSEEAEKRAARYRLMWNDVKYEPGELKVVAYDDNGNVAGEETVETAGTPAKLQLSADKTVLNGAEDLSYITVSLTDKDGTLIPTASDRLFFKVSGAGSFKAVCNGDATSTEVFTEPAMHLFNGQLVLTIKGSQQDGDVVVTVYDGERDITGTLILHNKK